MGWVGFIAGAIVGAYAYGVRGLVVGAAIGLAIGLLLRARTQPGPGSESGNAARIAALERRLSALEATLAPSGKRLPEVAQAAAPEAAAVPVAAPGRAGAPGAEAVSDASAVSPNPVRKGVLAEPGPARPLARAENASRPAPATPPLWAWFTGGNGLVRIGVVVLFFGVAFLLSYLAEHVTLPIELKFAGVAVAGGAMIFAGVWLRNARRAYALALVGCGLGVLYLTTFAAFDLVRLISSGPAFVLLAAIALFSIALSLVFDAQALAALAALGGMLAPFLVEAAGEPVALFGYVAAVNAVVVGIAWFRTWRALDLVGFIGTFVLGIWWGHEYYDPAYFRSVEPFLAAFFFAYVTVPIVHALRGGAERRVDATLIFGVPVVAFALQALLVEDTRYGLAWTAAVIAAMYALLWRGLGGRKSAPTATLAAAFGALAVIFATLCVPLAVDARWTSAAWAIEAAGVYWIGLRQDQRFARGFALLLQLASGLALLVGGFDEYAEMAFANRQFLGCAAIALSAFASVRFGDRRGPALPTVERSVLHLLFGWACVWWLGGGLAEIARNVADHVEAHAMLAWIAGSIGLAVMLARPLRWPRLEGTAVILLPALALSLGHDVAHGRTSATEYGWAVYPLAWALHYAVLYRREARAADARDTAVAAEQARVRQWLAAAHAFGALLLLAQIAWEAGEWTSRLAPADTVWPACAHLAPLALYLLALGPAVRAARWPMRTFAAAYASSAAAVVAVLLGLGFVALALLNPGDPQPLAYVPLANPLELTLFLALSALFVWARRDARISERSLYRWAGVGVFVLLNGMVARSVHHWLGVPWHLATLVASRPLQAGLTLTWTVAALAAMVAATRWRLRALWLTGAGLLAAVVIKLFVIDLAALSGLSRVVAFLGVGALLLVIGYVAPLPPAVPEPGGQKPS